VCVCVCVREREREREKTYRLTESGREGGTKTDGEGGRQKDRKREERETAV